MKITPASKKVLASALSAAMVVAFAPTVAFGATTNTQTENSVAKIEAANGGITYVDTLAELDNAMTGAGNGATITLLKNITSAGGTVGLTLAQGSVLDGAGHKIDVSSAGNLTIDVAAGSDIKTTVVKNIALGDDDGAVLNINGGRVEISNVDVKTVNIDDNKAGVAEGITISGTDTKIGALTGNEKIALTDGKFGDVAINSAGNVTVQSGTYEQVKVNSGGEFKLEDGGLTGAFNKYGLSVDPNTTVTVKGGSIAYALISSAGTVKASGGTWSFADTTSRGKITTDTGLTWFKNADGTYTLTAGIAAASVSFTEGATVVNHAPISATDLTDSVAKAIANVAGDWAKSIVNFTLPSNMTMVQGKTQADLFKANGASAVAVTTAAVDTYASVKDVTASSTTAKQKLKASYDAIDAAAAKAGLTVGVDKSSFEIANATTEAGKKAYNRYFGIAAQYKVGTTAYADITDLGTEVTYYIPVGASTVNDFSASNTYSIVMEDGTILPATVTSEKLYSAPATQATTYTQYLTFKTSKTGKFAVAYVDEFKNAQEEADKAKEEAEKAAAELVKAQDKAAAATGKAQVKGASYKIKAKGSKTIKIAASDSGAKVTLKQTSGTKYAKVSGTKVTLKKAAKKGKTYTIKVKAVCGATTTSAVAFKVVVK